MASHRLSEVYRQNKQGSSLGYGGKTKVDRAGPSSKPESPADAYSVVSQQKVLRQFDLTTKFGPCTNISRKQRWDRAYELGLDPPESVRVLLQQMETSHPEQHGIWAGRV